MATIKKTAAKPKTAKPKAAAKKPTAKKPAAKKPAVKKAAAKPAAKKPAVKKAAAKPAAKKPAVKKAAAPKPVAKPVEKKPAAKPVVKKPEAAKPVAKPIEKKPAAPEKAVKPAGAPDSSVKFRNLFDAFSQGKLPAANGFIVTSFFSETSAYSIYEIVSYGSVKEIFPSNTGLQFVSGGKKLYVLVEPDTYHNKPVEPVSRADGEKIPKRFNELETIIAVNQTRIMVAKEPNETFGSFTILKPQGQNFAVVFYDLPDIYESIGAFFEDSLNRQRRVPQSDAKKAAQLITSIVQKTMGSKPKL